MQAIQMQHNNNSSSKGNNTSNSLLMNGIPKPSLNYFNETKSSSNQLFDQVLRPATLDAFVYISYLQRAIDISNIFDEFKNRLHNNTFTTTGTFGNKITLELHNASVSSNGVAGLDKDKWEKNVKRICFIDYNEKTIMVNPNANGAKFLNVAFNGIMTYNDSGDKFSITMWIWNSGFFRLQIGNSIGNTIKNINMLSDFVVKSTAYDSLPKNIANLLWDDIIVRGLSGKDVDKLRPKWQLNSNSFTLHFKKPYSVDWQDIRQFKVYTAQMLEHHAKDETLENGYIATQNLSREDEDDSYFMLDINFISFDDIFKHITKSVAVADKGFELYDFQFDMSYWRSTSALTKQVSHILQERRFKKAFLDRSSHSITMDIAIDEDETKTTRIQLFLIMAKVKSQKKQSEPKKKVSKKEKNNNSNVNGGGSDDDANKKAVPKMYAKLFRDHKMQLNIASPTPWYTTWRGIVILMNALTRKGVPTSLHSYLKMKQNAYMWLESYIDKSIIDLNGQSLKATDKVAKTTMGRRGRKAESSCAKKKRPLPNNFDGKCEHLGNDYIVHPNDHGDPCCIKWTQGTRHKILLAYKKGGVKVPEHVLHSLGFDEVPDIQNNEDAPSNDYKVSFHKKSGKLAVNNRVTISSVKILANVAEQLGIPSTYQDGMKVYPKSVAKLKQEIAIKILISSGIPEFDDQYKDAAIIEILAIISPDRTPKSSYEKNVKLIKTILSGHAQNDQKNNENGDIMRDNGVTNKGKHESKKEVRSPEYPDPEFSPLVKPEKPKKKKTTKEVKLSDMKKQYLVLDKIFDFTSFDIPDYI